MTTASRAIDVHSQQPAIDWSFTTLAILFVLSPVGMVMLAQGLSWAVGPETVLLKADEAASYTMRLPCMRRCGDQRAVD